MPSTHPALAFLVILFCSAMGWAASVAAEEQPPNIVIILTDDQGYQDLGCFGAERIKTPHIDQMAAEGVRLTHFYAQAVCGPSRAALLTGCYPIRVAEPGNRKHQHTVLHPQEVTLAEVLKARGYATAAIGKWHVGRPVDGGWDPATMPNGQGFDYFFGTPLYNGFTVNVADARFRSPLLRNQEVVEEEVESWNNITADYTREALQFIERNRGRPFFLYLAHNMPHIPLGASESFAGRSEYGPYGDAVEEIDWSTGKILAAIRQSGLEHRTLVVFTSDNGPWVETTRGNQPGARPFIPRPHSGSAGPLRGYKMLTWEGGLRVPCVAWWPGRIPAGGVCDHVAATIDLLPTLAAAAKAEPPADRTLDGRNILPWLTGDNRATSAMAERDFLYYRYTSLEGVRSGRWKLVLPRPEHPPWTGFSGRFHGQGVAEVSLFDLVADPNESRNLAPEQPQVVSQLLEKIRIAREELGDYDRIGSGARFFDAGPPRPDLWRESKPQPDDKPVAYDKAPPVGPLQFQFEDGQLAGWTVTSGKFGQLISDRVGLPNHPGKPFNKQGRFLLFTGNRADRSRGDDSFVGVIESPLFRVTGERMSFLVGGGSDERTYVALCDREGRELLRASGRQGPELVRIRWDVSRFRDRALRMKIVDRSRGPWGHVTFDDFSCEGELLEATNPGSAVGDSAPWRSEGTARATPTNSGRKTLR